MGLFGKSKKQLIAEKDQLQNEIKQHKDKMGKLNEEIDRLNGLLTPEHRDMEQLKIAIGNLQKQQRTLDNEIELRNQTIEKQIKDIEALSLTIKDKNKQIYDIDNDILVQEYGVYKPHYTFANSDHYKAELIKVRAQQKQLIRDDDACSGNTNWRVNDSLTKGKAMVRDTKKLLLRAFNVECDDIVANIKVSNYEKSVERIYYISQQISKLGSIMGIAIRQSYISLKIQEVNLALDFQQKKQEEKEHIRELKEQRREAEKVRKEIEEERKKLLKEQQQYQNALATIVAMIDKHGQDDDLLAKKSVLEGQLSEIEKAIADVDYRSANERAGYVYIISNVGAFGEDVYKIGMTRRLDPQERVDELGDASVPFKFDVHAMIFSDDAPKLENALHHAFEAKKLNKINTRREFFKVSLDEIKKEVRKNFDKTVEWIDIPEAEQYRQSLFIDSNNK